MNNIKPTYEELEKRVKQLEIREQYYNHIIQNTEESILIIQNEKVKFANTKALKVSGYILKEITSLPLIKLIYPDDRSLVINNYRKET